MSPEFQEFVKSELENKKIGKTDKTQKYST